MSEPTEKPPTQEQEPMGPRKLPPIQKTRVRITISKNDAGDDLVDVLYGVARFVVYADAVEVNDLRPFMEDPPGSGPIGLAPAVKTKEKQDG